MTKEREALKLALRVLKGCPYGLLIQGTIDRIEESLAQPEQEPVASIYVTPGGEREFDDWRHDLPIGRNQLYTTPPAREWVGLTDDGRKQLRCNFDGIESIQLKTEAKLKELNHG